MSAVAQYVTIRQLHKDRKSLYSDCQFRREWFARGGLIHNMVVSCLMRDMSWCQCEAMIVKDATSVLVSIANAHKTQDHEEKKRIKYLRHQQKCLVAAAVKVSPVQTAMQLMHKFEVPPYKVIDQTLSKSVARMVRQERKSLTTVALEGVDVDNLNTLGSLVKLAEILWIDNAFKQHKQGECIN